MSNGNPSDLKMIAAALVVVVLLLVVGAVFLVPAAAPLAENMSQGLSLKESVPWGFGLTVALLVLFALVAGDGLIGELQFMLSSFFIFFLVLTLLIAWVF